MKKRTEKQPVDDLFARKLKTMSLPTSPDGFARLKARMNQNKPETRVVFWRSATIQRYGAIAASLLLICLFGWLYISSETPVGSGATVATSQPSVTPIGKRHRYAQSNPQVDIATNQTQIALRKKSLSTPKTTDGLVVIKRGQLPIGRELTDRYRPANVNRRRNEVRAPTQDIAAATQVKPTGRSIESKVAKPTVEPLTEKQVTAATTNSALVAERVLVVTVAEPQALVAARQAVATPAGAKEMVADADKSEKETKAINLWQQMKRVKQGEIFARKDAVDDERGLLGRAYSGLKQTFDKDKSIKQ